MTELKDRGENWSLSSDDSIPEPELRLQQIVTASAMINVSQFGVNAVVNAYVGACINIVAKLDLDPEELQRMLRNCADQVPDAIAALRLSGMQAGNDPTRPS